MTSILQKNDTIKKILAQTLFELNPKRSLKEWETHIEQTGHDAKAFFSGNGEGLEEYHAFTRSYDRDNYLRKQKRGK